MKKLILITVLLLTVKGISQEKKESVLSKNELKINLAYLIAGFPEITYERALTEETSIGISALFSIENNEENISFNFAIIPYYRIYFGEKPNTGFFVDGNLGLYSQKKTDGDLFTNEKEGGLGLGVGFNLGKKYRTKKGWIGELSFGITRTITNQDNVNSVYLRGGIIIGKIF
jgi:hypothetical protein